MRIVVLACPGDATEILLNALVDHGFDDVQLVIEPRVPRKAMLTWRWRRLGAWAVLGQVAFIALVQPVLARQARGRRAALLAEHGLRETPLPAVPRHAVASVNTPGAVALLRDLAPDVVLVNGTRILRRAILTAVPAPFVNMHAGITPRYRGVHGGYWALAMEDTENFGTTLHLVDEGVDTGQILEQVRERPGVDDNFTTYPLVQQATTLPALMRILDAFPAEGLPEARESAGDSQQWFHPTLWQYLWHRLRRGVR